MTEYVGRGDQRRAMTLLWGRRDPRSRGPKPGLSVSEIVAAGIAVADAEGLPAVSMRNVARRLDRTAMSLYTYVPGKSELLELMLDTVLGELPTDYPRPNGWRAAVEQAARDDWQLYQRHPWMLHISGSRPLLGPNELARQETRLRLFDGLGLAGVDMARMVGTVGCFVRGAARDLVDARAAEQATGLSDDDWWLARSPLLDEFVEPEVWPRRYPTLDKLAAAQAYDQPDRQPDDDTPYTVWTARDMFEFGLPRLLDGVEAFITARGSRTQ